MHQLEPPSRKWSLPSCKQSREWTAPDVVSLGPASVLDPGSHFILVSLRPQLNTKVTQGLGPVGQKPTQDSDGQSLLQSSLVDCPRLYQIYRLSLFNTILLAFIFHECFSNKLFVLLTAPQFSASQRTQLICLCPVADTKTGHSSSESTP